MVKSCTVVVVTEIESQQPLARDGVSTRGTNVSGLLISTKAEMAEHLPLNKVDLIELCVSKLDLSFLCFCEHWLCDEKFISLCINNFKLISKFCCSDHVHGALQFLPKIIFQNSVNQYKLLIKFLQKW